MAIIQISNLTFGYDSSIQPIFKDLTLTLDSKWKLGLIGRNGKGKTTFLRLLAHEELFSGCIQANINFERFPVELSNLDQPPIEVFHTLCPFQEDWTFVSELNQLDPQLVDEIYSRPLSSFSPGEQEKLLMASLFCKPKTFLLMDEPETHLDLEGRKALARYLKGKQGFILVSHDRMLLDELVDHILYIDGQEITLQTGNYSSWQANQEAKIQGLLQKNEQLHREISRLDKACKQTKKWGQKAENQKKQEPRQKKQAKEFIDRGFQGHKAAKIMKRSKALQKRQEKAIAQKKNLLQEVDNPESVTLPTLSSPYKTLLCLENVQVIYKESNQTKDNSNIPPLKIVPRKPVSFVIHPKERIALSGFNGIGKSSILKAIQGSVAYQGTITKPEKLVCSIVNQDVYDIQGSFYDFAKTKQLDSTLFMTLLRKLGFEREIFHLDLSVLSLGQKKKVALAASLSTPAHLYIWDEPLSHLDSMSRQQIEEMIVQSEAAILLIEHDERFLQTIQAKIIKLGES